MKKNDNERVNARVRTSSEQSWLLIFEIEVGEWQFGMEGS